LRGIEGKIMAIRMQLHGIPFFGLVHGMQSAVSEFAAM
jgi:CTP synthase (UTP-ammonia lyase)